jgi:hypothetical protein
MESQKVIEVLDTLVGTLFPIGETEYDEEVYKNLECMIEVVKHILSTFEDVMCENENSKEHSRQECYTLVSDFINQYCR